MELIPESVSEREAEQQYPTQYWEGTKIKRSFDMTTDDLQDAYMRGREAEPCEEQAEAVARVLRDTFAWNHVEAPERVEDYHGLAREILDAARKAVM